MLIKENKIRIIIRKALLKEYQRGSQQKRSDYRTGLTGRGEEKDLDFETGDASVSSGVKWGEGAEGIKRHNAWKALQPFLPNSTILTSCYRSQEDQERIIRNKAQKFNYSGPDNLDDMHKFITQKPKPGQVVARNVGTGHGGKSNTGAFDLSGADLDQIWAGVTKANEKLAGLVKFAPLNGPKGFRSIIERKNNAVHVHFNLKDVKITDADIPKIKKDLTVKDNKEKSSSELNSLIKPNNSVPSMTDLISNFKNPKKEYEIKEITNQQGDFSFSKYDVLLHDKNDPFKTPIMILVKINNFKIETLKPGQVKLLTQDGSKEDDLGFKLSKAIVTKISELQPQKSKK